MDSVDLKSQKLIKELQERIKKQDAEKTDNDMSGYTCNKCKMPVNFTFIMQHIRASGKCPSCFHED